MNRQRQAYHLQQILFGWLNLLLVAPQIYLYIGLPMILRQHGWDARDIGIIQLSGLMALFKFILAMPMERWPQRRRRYRAWFAALCCAYAAVLWALGQCDPAEQGRHLLFWLAMACSLLASWADTPLNALAIQILPETERLSAGAIRAAATSLGAIIGGGGMLLLQTHEGWQLPWRVLAVGLLSGLPLLACIRRDSATKPAGLVRPSLDSVWQAWLAWFSYRQHRFWAVLLLLYYPLMGTVWVFLKPLLWDAGVAPARIATWVGIGGGAMAAISSLGGGWYARRQGAVRALPVFALGDLLSVAGLAVVSLGHASAAWMLLAAMAVAWMMGASGGLVFGLMMLHARSGSEALDYGLQASLLVLGRSVLPWLAGVLIDQWGYLGWFSGLLLALSGLLLWIWRHRRQDFSTVAGLEDVHAQG